MDGWTCHVCGDYRPDDLIGVVSTTRVRNNVEIIENVRYCRDRPACLEGAETKTWLGPNLLVRSRRVT